MSIPRSPSVPTTMGSSVSSRTDAQYGGRFAHVRSCGAPPGPRASVPLRAGTLPGRRPLAYGVAVAVAERDLTARGSVLPWSGVVAPWLFSRIVSIVVLLPRSTTRRAARASTRSPPAGTARSTSTSPATATGPVDVPFPKWPFFPLLPGIIRMLERGRERQGRDLRVQPARVPGRAGRGVPAGVAPRRAAPWPRSRCGPWRSSRRRSCSR